MAYVEVQQEIVCDRVRGQYLDYAVSGPQVQALV